MNYWSVPALIEGSIALMTPAQVIGQVANRIGVREASLYGRNRSGTIVFARHLSMYVLRKKLNYSLKEIGSLYHRDHTTVIYACQMIENYLETNHEIRGPQIIQVLSEF